MTPASTSPPSPDQRRRRAVELRLAGQPLAAIRAETGLSAPTIIAAHKTFVAGGWAAVAARRHGRAAGQGRALTATQESRLKRALTSQSPATLPLWTVAAVRDWAAAELGRPVAERTVQRMLARWGLLPPTLREAAAHHAESAAWAAHELPAIAQRAHAVRATLLWCANLKLPDAPALDAPGAPGAAASDPRAAGDACAAPDAPDAPARLLVAQTLRGAPAWLPVRAIHDARAHVDFLDRVRGHWPGPLTILLHGVSPHAPALADWIARQTDLRVEPCPVGLPLPTARPAPSRPRPAPGVAAPATVLAPPATAAATMLAPAATAPATAFTPAAAAPATAHAPAAAAPAQSSSVQATPTTPPPPMKLTHLQRLEAESIHILREVVATCERPVMLYSVGKDSACMLHLAKKAFWPAPPPFPLLHVDTTWKFRDMYELRDRMAREAGMELLVWRNPEAERLGINPFDHGSQIHTDLWKTQGLKQALDHHGFDAAFGGARRDEEKSRAKERIFSFRDARHHWDPKRQRPELWHLYNTRKHKGESIRVFPLSNWTELDVWQYIHRERIPVVPLYLARERPVVERDGALIMVDDDRMPLRAGELPVMRRVRFRTLGCYPLSGAIESDADTLGAVIAEMLAARSSERQGRLIDHDQAASMERKKQEGYF